MKIVHIFRDCKFFDSVSDFFDSIDGIENLYPFYCRNLNYQFKYIHNVDKVKKVNHYNDYISYLNADDTDVIYFHGIHFSQYKLFKYIGARQKVIWWCWGTEIYDYGICNHRVINMELYKSYTRKHMLIHPSTKDCLIKIYQILFGWYNWKLKKKVINRVDYFSPVLPIEYDMMIKECPYFRAKPFMDKRGPGSVNVPPLSYKKITGNIMIGHSLSYSTNILDLLEIVKDINIASSRDIYIPISYGNAYGGKEKFMNQHTYKKNFKWLPDFLPYSDYCKIYGSITHAIFGVLRQQGLGNISLCIRMGCKMFFYKDSIVYKHLKSSGYVVFSIEDDLNEKSLIEPLTKEDALHNYELHVESNNKTFISVREDLNKIENT